MRLPTITDGHKQLEDARAFHEAVWSAHDAGQRYYVQTEPDRAGKELIRLSHRFHKFWSRRGFILRCKQLPLHCTIEIWLQVKRVN